MGEADVGIRSALAAVDLASVGGASAVVRDGVQQLGHDGGRGQADGDGLVRAALHLVLAPGLEVVKLGHVDSFHWGHYKQCFSCENL